MITTLGMIELNSIARGIETADFMLKAADVSLVFAKTACPGKYIIAVAGEVAAVNAAVQVGQENGQGFVINTLVIASVHSEVIPAINGTMALEDVEALGVMEYFDITAAVTGADAAAKAAEVRLIEIRLGMGIGGKSFVTMCGSVSCVQEAVKAGLVLATEQGSVLNSCVIPSPTKELFQSLM